MIEALVINPTSNLTSNLLQVEIETVLIDPNEIADFLGFRLDSMWLPASQETLYCNDEGLYVPNSVLWQALDMHSPIAGRALICRTGAEGEAISTHLTAHDITSNFKVQGITPCS